jgi:hypothetical protein
MKKIIAGFFILIILSPFTEPWPTCPLAQLMRGSVAPAVSPLVIVGEVARIPLLASSAAVAPAIAIPITLLPPPRTKVGQLRLDIASAFDPPVVVVATWFVSNQWDGWSISRSGPSVLPALTPILRL